MTVQETTLADDEAIARALQAQYEDEYRRASASSHPRVIATTNMNSNPSAPPLGLSEQAQGGRAGGGHRGRYVGGVVVESAPPPPSTNSNPHSKSRHESDEEYARRLEQELRDEELARSLQPGSGGGGPIIIPLDAQGQRDEQLARSLQAEQLQLQQRRSRCNTRTLLKSACTIIVVLAAVVAVVVVFTGGDGESGTIPGLPDFWPDEDPWAGTDPANPDEMDKWRTNNNNQGLKLKILNALESEWHPFFFEAVSDWDNGVPDALTLSTETISPESECSHQRNVMKVCNGDYGDTRWRGVNVVSIEGGWITSSIAKMNQYYLNNADSAQRQYTMCHEIGHGFGLPHTDENFNNEDLGNCMDYTNNPEVNKRPDDTNYNLLKELYGEVSANRRRRRRDLVSSPGGWLLRGNDNLSVPRDLSNSPPLDMALYESAISELLYGSRERRTTKKEEEDSSSVSLHHESNNQKWRVLQKSDYGETHVLDVDEEKNQKIVIHMLLR